MKNLRVQVLERVIKHTIRGDSERAGRLMEKLMTAIGSQIVNEANYGNTDDPMFPARRELQRELEDDLELDRVDMADGEETSMTDDPAGVPGAGECEDGECSPEVVAQMISDLIKAGGIDEDKLAQIVDIIATEEPAADVEGGEGELDVDAVPGEEVPADEPAIEDPAAEPAIEDPNSSFKA